MSENPDNVRTASGQYRFSLATVFLATTVVSTCLAMAKVHLGLGVLISFLTIPALIRTVLVANREARAGSPISAMGKFLEFLFSWTLMLPIGLASLIVGSIALFFVSMLSFIVMGLFDGPWRSWLAPQFAFVLEAYFVVTMFTVAIGSGGLVLTLGIRSSLRYRPVARI